MNTLRLVSTAFALVLGGCTTIQVLPPTDLTAVETALRLLLVEDAATVDPTLAGANVTGLSNVLRHFQLSLAAAQRDAKLCLIVKTEGERPVSAQFSTISGRLKQQPCLERNPLTVNIERKGIEYVLRMFYNGSTEWIFRLVVDPNQTTNLFFRGAIDSYGPALRPVKPAILEIPRSP